MTLRDVFLAIQGYEQHESAADERAKMIAYFSAVMHTDKSGRRELAKLFFKQVSKRNKLSMEEALKKTEENKKKMEAIIKKLKQNVNKVS